MPEPEAKTRAAAPPESRHAAALRRGFPRLTFDSPLEEEFVRAYRFEGWELNVRLRRLKSPQGDSIALRNAEFNLLAAFLASPQRVLSREQLLTMSHLHNDEVYDRAIDTQVGRLRKKIESPDAKEPLIRTERGAGYVFTGVVEVVR